MCGQLIRPTDDWKPPDELRAFLDAGEPPIYVGFGSMTGFDRQQLRDAIVGAIAGRRALFYPGWSGIDPSSLPGNFFVLGDTPHDWLFPRTSLVIHHGGSGTTHSGTTAQREVGERNDSLARDRVHSARRRHLARPCAGRKDESRKRAGDGGDAHRTGHGVLTASFTRLWSHARATGTDAR